jgi:hypothetical protein
VIGTNLGSGSDIISVELAQTAATIVSQTATQVIVTAGGAGIVRSGDVRIVSISFGPTTLTNGFAYTEGLCFFPLSSTVADKR